MLKALRQSQILAAARTRGEVRIGELTRRFGVSEPTIRRDLEALAGRGLLARVHGGALAVSSAAGAAERSRAARLSALGEAAAALVPPGSTVGLSAGEATAEVARWLREVPGLTIVTPSLPAAQRLRGSDRHELILVGGVRTPAGGHAGPLAVATLRRINLDLAFVAVRGMSPRTGYTVEDLLTAETDRAMLDSAGRRVVVADHTTWGAVGVATLAALADVDVVVTGAGLPAAAQAILAAQVGLLKLA